MKQCYQLGCFFNIPHHEFCGCNCRPFPGYCCPPCQPHTSFPQQPNHGCGCINVAIPIGFVYFASGFLLGQNTNCYKPNCWQ